MRAGVVRLVRTMVGLAEATMEVKKELQTWLQNLLSDG